jgi:hypothetical protein
MKHKLILVSLLIIFLTPLLSFGGVFAATPVVNPNDKGIGMEGTLVQPPPTDAPTIILPNNNQSFDEIPVTVSGLCVDTLLVRVFKNNVFGGAAICDGGSYELQIDLFPGNNELKAVQYDDLDQASPESNKVNVVYTIDVPHVPGSPDQVAQRITLTSNFARRGANPGDELSWPVTISGGRSPYAVSVDWGDGKNELLTRNAAGTFDLKHAYERPGVYRVIVKATDADGQSAFLQLVGVGNGSIDSSLASSEGGGGTVIQTKIIWQPALIMFPLLLASFWLGKRYQLKRVRYRIKNRIAPVDK